MERSQQAQKFWVIGGTQTFSLLEQRRCIRCWCDGMAGRNKNATDHGHHHGPKSVAVGPPRHDGTYINERVACSCLVRPQDERAFLPRAHQGDADDPDGVACEDDGADADACEYCFRCAYLSVQTRRTVMRYLRARRRLSRHPKRQPAPRHVQVLRVVRDAIWRSCRWFPAIQSCLPCASPFPCDVSTALKRYKTFVLFMQSRLLHPVLLTVRA